MKLSQFDLIASLAANHTDTIISSDTKTGVLRRSNIFICKNGIRVKTDEYIVNFFTCSLSPPCNHENII